jgi:2-C-methyl-D-erythritol 4-phosphate cytidylyltransferase
VLEWAVRRLLRLRPATVVVALEPERAAAPRPEWLPSAVRIVAGGVDRAASVANALAVIEGEPGDLVAVHDAARPAVDLADFEAVLRAAAAHGAAILGRRVTDTVKRIEADRVVETVDRSALGRAETPQVARLDLLRTVLLPPAPGSRLPAPSPPPTDESSALEALGIPVAWVEAGAANPKLTVPADLPMLELLLRGLSHELGDRERIAP